VGHASVAEEIRGLIRQLKHEEGGTGHPERGRPEAGLERGSRGCTGGGVGRSCRREREARPSGRG